MIVCDTSTCQTCGACIGVCPVDTIAMNTHEVVIDHAVCIRCGACVEICPVVALFEDADEIPAGVIRSEPE